MPRGFSRGCAGPLVRGRPPQGGPVPVDLENTYIGRMAASSAHGPGGTELSAFAPVRQCKAVVLSAAPSQEKLLRGGPMLCSAASPPTASETPRSLQESPRPAPSGEVRFASWRPRFP